MTPFLIYTITIIAIWFVQAIGLNLQFGVAGLANFGCVLFFGLGAYGTAVCAEAGLPIWLGVVSGLIVAVVLSAVFAAPARNRNQDYWALLTLGGAESVRLLVINTPDLAGGVNGAAVPFIESESLALTLAIGLAVVAGIVCVVVSRAPVGRLLRVMREDPSLVESFGKFPFPHQVKIMMLGGGLAALAGSLYAHVIGYISPDMLTVDSTVLIWVLVIVGGSGSTRGVLLGTLVVMTAYSVSTFLPQWTGISAVPVANLRVALIGLFLTAMVVLRPQGLIPERTGSRHA